MGQRVFIKTSGLFFLCMGSLICFGQENGIRRRLQEMKGDDDQLAQVAELELLAMGGKAVEPLEKILEAGEGDGDYAEARRIFPKVLEKSGRLTPVTVHFKNADLRDVVKEFNAQNPKWNLLVGQWKLLPMSVTMDLERVPYNVAVMELGRRIEGATDDGALRRLRFSESKAVRPTTAEWGNVVILDSVDYVRTMDYEMGTRSEAKLSATLKVMMDPGIKALYGGVFKDLEGVDENGRKLTFGKKAMDSVDYLTPILMHHDLSIEIPDWDLKKIARLKGKVYERVGTDFESWTIEDIAKAAGMSRQIGDVKMTVKEAGMLDAYQARIVLSLTIPTPVDPEVGEEISRNIPFILMDGAISAESEIAQTPWRVNAQGCQTNVQVGDERKVDYICILANATAIPPRDLKIKVTIPSKMSGIWVGFDFKDVELP